MATQDFVPAGNADFCLLLAHVAQNLPQFYGNLGITGATTQVAAFMLDNLAFSALCSRQETLVQAGQSATTERNRARYGDKVNPGVATNFSYPIPPATFPNAVMPGIEKRFRDFVDWLRSLTNFEDAMGVALHLVGPQSTPVDPATLQPTLKLRISGGKVEILWGWDTARGIAKALYIEVDRTTGPAFLAADTNPNYTDSHPLPATPQKWRYRAIWQRDGEMIGQWSPWIEITVSA